MKLIQILPELNSGGVERGTLEIGRFMVQEGHESIVISNGGRLVERLESEGSRHITLPVHRKSLRSLTQIKELRKVFEQEQPDIIHLRSRLPAWLAWLAWRRMDSRTRPRLITTVHGFYSVNAYSRIMTRGELVIAVSNSVREYILKNYQDVPMGKIEVIHRGVDPQEFPYEYQPDSEWIEQWHHEYPHLKEKILITLPGRITQWKGQLDFIKVIAELRKKGAPVHGLLAGESHPKKQRFLEEIKGAIDSAGIKEDISFLGHRKDVREIMAISRIIVSCSTDPEAFGRVSLEALALGKPVIGYNHGGVREQLEAIFPIGQVEVGNVSGMTDLIQTWIEEGYPAPRIKNVFTLENMQVKTLQCYKSLLARPR